VALKELIDRRAAFDQKRATTTLPPIATRGVEPVAEEAAATAETAEPSNDVTTRATSDGPVPQPGTTYTPRPSASLSPAVTQAIALTSGGTSDGPVPQPGTAYTPPPSASLSPAVTQNTPYTHSPTPKLSPALTQLATQQQSCSGIQPNPSYIRQYSAWSAPN